MAHDWKVEPLPTGHPEEVANLALALSRTSAYSRFSQDYGPSKHATADEIEDEGSVIDPSHPQFDAYKWAKSMIETGQKKGLKQRKMSVLFQNLNIYASNEAQGFQKTVGFPLREPANIWRSILSPPAKKTIIRQFEGVLRNGEMLLVLGRPGSGCSTLLKTISGNVHGLAVDPSSTLQYNGAMTPST